MNIIEEAAIPAMKRLNVRFYRDEERSAILVPMHFGDTSFLIGIYGEDEANTAVISMERPFKVPPAQRGAVSIAISEMNARYMFVTLSLSDGIVRADSCVDLEEVSDPEYHIRRAFVCLCRAIDKEHTNITKAAKPGRNQRPSRLDRDISEILGQAGI